MADLAAGADCSLHHHPCVDSGASQEMDDDPVVFLANDWRSQVVIAIGAVLLFVAGMR